MNEAEKRSLLRRFEPVLKFTKGEKFYPYNVVDYVSRSSLWVKSPETPPEVMIPENALDLEMLGSLKLQGMHNVYYLQFISPLNIREMAAYRIKEFRDSVKGQDFQPSRSRLARVGYLARLVDALYSMILFLRGRVPGDAMIAAVQTFNKMLEENHTFKYYGRVIEQSGWIILQYWYFYPFNNWRSGFFGANDHEADWEMVNIYCYQDQQGVIKPNWVAYASHNFSGDDLRRHWRDPELEKVDGHPIVYVGGGSHASYFQAGEYLTELSFPFLRPIRRIVSGLRKFFSAVFQEERSPTGGGGEKSQLFSIPFVDYALGDGLAIGPGCAEKWSEPEVIEPTPNWVAVYDGLWGYYAQDKFSGEDAPAGPRYNRDGTVRRAWYDPLGWAGMEKVVPPNMREKALEERIGETKQTIQTLEDDIAKIQAVHFQRGIDLGAYQDEPNLQSEVSRIQELLAEERQLLAEKRERLMIKQAALKSLEGYRQSTHEETIQALQAHIQHAHRPQIKRNLRFQTLAEIWAAISIGLMMIGVVLMVLFARRFLLVGFIGMALVLSLIEAAFRRRLAILVRWVAISLAIFGFLILAYEFFWIFALVVLMITGFYMIIENLRELFAR